MIPREDVREASALGKILRSLGALAFLGGAAVFLMEGWSQQAVASRPMLLGGATLLLTLLGIWSVRALGDARGARMFLTLSVVTVPAQFAELGAQLWDYRTSASGSVAQLLASFVLLLACFPALVLGVSSLVRGRGAQLTGLLFLLCSLLLIPCREASFAEVVSLAELGALCCAEMVLFRRDVRFQTGSGLAMRLLLLVPALLILARHAWYAPHTDWYAAVVAFSSCVLLLMTRVLILRGMVARVVLRAGLLGISLACVLVVSHVPLAVLLVGTFFASAPLLFHSLGEGRASVATRAIACLLLMVSALGGIFSPDALYLLCLVPLSAVHVLAAYRSRAPVAMVVAIAGSLFGCVSQLALMIQIPPHDAWVLPSGVGIALLLLASVAESKRTQLASLWGRVSHPRGVV